MTALRCLLFLLLLLPFFAAAQDVPRRAEKKFQKAQTLKWQRKEAKAERELYKLLTRFPAWAEPYLTLAQWKAARGDYKAARTLLEYGMAHCRDGKKIFSYPLANVCLYQGQYEQALQLADTGAHWEALRRQIHFLKNAGPAPAGAVALPMHKGRINTNAAEMFPQLSADGKWLYYTRLSQGVNADLYRAKRDSCGGWFSGRKLPYPISTSAGEQAAMYSADRHYLFFTRCDMRSPNGVEGGGCDLFMAYTVFPDDSLGAQWSTPQSFGFTINTPAYEGEPCLSADNRELFFVSDRAGGYGGKDIYVSRFEGGRWQMPRNLGPEINTPGDETSPFLHPDGQSFYFSSTGHPGFGGSDIFKSRRINDTVWAAPQNLGRPYNSLRDDFGATVSLAGDTLYFTSDRDSAAGNYDLYEAWLAPHLQPGKVSIIQGFVRDSLSRQPLNYTMLYFRDSATGNKYYQVQSNRGDGSYTLLLPRGETWLIEASRVSYSLRPDTFRDESLVLWPPADKDFALLPAGYQKPVQDSLLLILYFQKNMVHLSDSAAAQLASVLEAANRPEAMILVNGYTDNSGTPLINEQLSTLRAQLVRDYLTGKGWNPAEILAHGWGEANPLTDNSTEESRDLNRRVEVWLRW